MPHRPITEYAAKKIMTDAGLVSTRFFSVQSPEQRTAIITDYSIDPASLWVVKPDQWFGKRGERGLLGLKLTPHQVTERLQTYTNKTITIDDRPDTLRQFIIEEFFPHQEERFVCIQTTRTGYQIQRSNQGWIGIEERFDHVTTMTIPTHRSHTTIDTLDLPDILTNPIRKLLTCMDTNDRVYAEINPFGITTQGDIQALDAVIKVDDTAHFRHPSRSDPFFFAPERWKTEHPSEAIIRHADTKTWASLKLTILNPNGSIRLIAWWGWASVVTMDTYAHHGLIPTLGNYGELSGNPDEDNCFLYCDTLIRTMLASSASHLTLAILWWIANFTDITVFGRGLHRALEKNRDWLTQRSVRIIRRRGGINDSKVQSLIAQRCHDNAIPRASQPTTNNLAQSISNLVMV